MAITTGSSFDWVTVRAACSAAHIFASLKMGAEQDVQVRNATLPKNANYAYAVQADGNMFGVVLEASVSRAVFFTLDGDGVAVKREDTNQKWRVVPTINNDGQCRLKVKLKDKDEELECWQFRKLALEDLFFTSPWDR